MDKLIVVVVAAFFALAFPASAYALESGATCDAGEDSLEQTVVDEGVPAPGMSPRSGLPIFDPVKTPSVRVPHIHPPPR